MTKALIKKFTVEYGIKLGIFAVVFIFLLLPVIAASIIDISINPILSVSVVLWYMILNGGWILLVEAALVIWFIPITERHTLPKKQRYFTVPMAALGIVAGAAAVIAAAVFVVMGVVNAYESHIRRLEDMEIGKQIDAFAARTDERLYYMYHLENNTVIQDGIFYSGIDRPCVLIDYVEHEIMFVYADYYYKPGRGMDGCGVFTCKLEEVDYEEKTYSDFWGNKVTRPYAGQDSEWESMAFLNEPGYMLYTYNYETESYSGGDTNAAVIVMADGTMWRARFDQCDIGMDIYVHGIQLCHLNDYEETQKYAEELAHTQYYKANGR